MHGTGERYNMPGHPRSGIVSIDLPPIFHDAPTPPKASSKACAKKPNASSPKQNKPAAGTRKSSPNSSAPTPLSANPRVSPTSAPAASRAKSSQRTAYNPNHSRSQQTAFNHTGATNPQAHTLHRYNLWKHENRVPDDPCGWERELAGSWRQCG